MGDQKNNDGILVEGQCGRAVEIDVDTLSRLLRTEDRASTASLRLVFVSSCHSQEIGEVFIRAGADHVIAVRRDLSVLNDAACLFAKAFYRTYLNDATVQDAFEHAKLQVSATSSFDPSQFILLSSSKNQTLSKAFLGISPGQFLDLRKKPRFAELPSKPSVCLGREVDMFIVFDLCMLIYH